MHNKKAFSFIEIIISISIIVLLTVIGISYKQ
ncbi:prepilin-type N-terminal cleavage/methylation domain-containing protein [bacterium]|nr:prepilin-type N-terminal cleavage/methylation domain-containing protein [bacterium]MBT3853520.1 prepilin-type N-terminal cleavage/methylation domain-containing protein [bacterium]MBT4632525.1 prepilin-type N-terminal cleavage/methylation domain-containing protein [bacterium]MBT6778752.1 prepilin-type N-terminal cleavage/methylation domain-containing protein [bacterium]